MTTTRTDTHRVLIVPDPAKMKRLQDPDWTYTPASETNVTKTWRRFGWFPVMAFRSPR